MSKEIECKNLELDKSEHIEIVTSEFRDMEK